MCLFTASVCLLSVCIQFEFTAGSRWRYSRGCEFDARSEFIEKEMNVHITVQSLAVFSWPAWDASCVVDVSAASLPTRSALPEQIAVAVCTQKPTQLAHYAKFKINCCAERQSGSDPDSGPSLARLQSKQQKYTGVAFTFLACSRVRCLNCI